MCIIDQELIQLPTGRYQVIRTSTNQQTFNKMPKKELKTTTITTENGEKQYTTVASRLLHFRSESKYADWSIIEKVMELSEVHVLMRVTITDEDGRIRSRAHAHEDKGSSLINTTSFVENAGTSALGRALGYLGIGITDVIATQDEVVSAVAQQEVIKKEEENTKQVEKEEVRNDVSSKVDAKIEAAAVVDNNERVPDPKDESSTYRVEGDGPRATMIAYYELLVKDQSLTFKDIMQKIIALKKEVDKEPGKHKGIEAVDITYTDFKSFYKTVPMPIGRKIFDTLVFEKNVVEKFTKNNLETLTTMINGK